MLLTHSPVADDVLLHLAAPRLACVKPIASVHPEPESNSPLLVFCLFVLCVITQDPVAVPLSSLVSKMIIVLLCLLSSQCRPRFLIVLGIARSRCNLDHYTLIA